MQRFLIIVERAYTGAIEGQYGHALWLCWSNQRLGHKVSVLLRNDAVLYARRKQHKLELTIGSIQVPNLFDYLDCLEGLLSDGGSVYALRDDVDRLQLASAELHHRVELIEHAQLADLVANCDVVWYW